MREGNAAFVPCSTTSKQNKVLVQMQELGMFNNQLQGALPESWSNLTNVSPQR